MTSSAVVGVMGLVCWAAVSGAMAGEFRTSVRGKPLVRRATYQAPATRPTDAPTPTESIPGSITIVPGASSPSLVDVPPGVIDSAGIDPDYEGMGGACATGCDTGCGGPCPRWSYWSSFEFLLWWRQNQPMPALVTTSPVGTDYAVAGVLGQPTTQVLYPSDEQGSDARPGGRLTLGVWCDPCQISGFGGRLYSLGDMTSSFDVDSDMFPILGRPYFNLTLSEEDADLVAYPGYTVGGISVESNSDVSGGDAFFRRMVFRDDYRRIDLLAGYQFAAIDSSLLITTNRVSIRQQGTIPYGTVIDMYDSFDTTNRYHAGEIGLVAELDRPTITWSVLAKVGLGNVKQRTTITGQTVVAVPGEEVVITPVGLLALGTNVGVYERNQFTVSPEIQLSAAYHLSDCVDLLCGYSFIYWNHVAQAGGQIDDVINTTQIEGELVGDPRPAFLDQDSDFFVHGLNFGVQIVW